MAHKFKTDKLGALTVILAPVQHIGRRFVHFHQLGTDGCQIQVGVDSLLVPQVSGFLPPK